VTRPFFNSGLSMPVGTRFLAAAALVLTIGAGLPLAAYATQPARPATPTTTPAAPAPATAAKPPATTGSTAAPTAQRPATAAPQTTAAAPAAGGPQTISRSDFELVVTLLRNTLVALHQANITGNYTVLRDLGAPGFRDANSATRLSEIFAPIRSRGVDLSRVVLIDPNLTMAKINEMPRGLPQCVDVIDAKPVGRHFGTFAHELHVRRRPE